MIKDQDRYPYAFLILYAATYMTNAVYNAFIPVYLDHIGFNKSLIGSLLATGMLIAIVVVQPVWGYVSDRSPTKNLILKILLLGSAGAILLYPLSNTYIFVLGAIAVFSIFQSSINPISDAIALEYLKNSRWNFGPIRMAGTIGFAVTSIITGIIAQKNIYSIFSLYCLIAFAGFLGTFFLPTIRNNQRSGREIKPWLLLKNKPLMLLIAFSFVMQLTLGFYYSFFSIYFRQLGATNSMLGLAMFITALSEVPFLLSANRIIVRLGIPLTLVISALIMSARWLLLHSLTDLTAIMIVNSSHGFSFIVFSYCLAVFINQNVPSELKASGQTLNALICMGLARILGSVAGGFISDLVSIRQVFLYTSLIGFAASGVFGLIFRWQRKRSPGQTAAH